MSICQPFHNLSNGLSLAQQIVGGLSRPEIDSTYSLSDKPDQLCGMGFDVVPLPALIVSRLSCNILVSHCKTEGFPVFGKPFQESRNFVVWVFLRERESGLQSETENSPLGIIKLKLIAHATSRN